MAASDAGDLRITIRLRPDTYAEIVAIMDRAGLTGTQFFPMALVIGARRLEEQLFPEKAADFLTPEAMAAMAQVLIEQGVVAGPGRSPGTATMLGSVLAGVLQSATDQVAHKDEDKD